jgi:hypothetical protein
MEAFLLQAVSGKLCLRNIACAEHPNMLFIDLVTEVPVT